MKFSITFIFLAFCFANAFASEPSIWTVNSRADVLRGDARGVSVTDTGAIVLAPKLNKLFDSQQSYIWSSAVDEKGNVYLGTGNDGKIFVVDAKGNGSIFVDLPELDVSAIAIAKNGDVFAGTSPDGKVYRITSAGKMETFFDPADKYIWSLAFLNDGSLAVGTGENGKIYRVKTANAKPDDSLLFDTSDTHIMSLAADRSGSLFAGTDSNGLVLKFSSEGKPFALLDSTLREIHDVAVASDGSIYVLALSESASKSGTAGVTADATPAAATVSLSEPNLPEQPQKSRYDLSTAKSAVYRITSDGASEVIWSSNTVTGFSVAANQNGNGCLIGTSDKGRVYAITNDGRETLLLQSEEGQISTLKNFGGKVFATSSNQGRLFSFDQTSNAEGTYESAVFDAKSTALWGRIWWNSSGDVQIQTRSGNTEKPDESWSAWSAGSGEQKGIQMTNPRARFIQWRATLKSSAVRAMLEEVNVSFVGNNIAPEVLSIQILPTNVGFATNPPIQIDPGIESSGMDPMLFGVIIIPQPPRKIYQRGARSLQWTAEDRNGDRLEYAIYYRVGDSQNFILLREGLRENFFSLDGLAFADGRYVFKVIAKDSPSNPFGKALSGERLSEAIEIDNTSPVVVAIGTPQIVGDKARFIFEATDALSFIRRAEFSIDGGSWTSVYSDDGIADGAKERFTIEVPFKSAGEISVTLRAYDANGNAGTARSIARR